MAQLKIEELVETALYGKNPSGDPRAQTERGKAGWDSGFGGKRDGEEERMSVPMGRVGMIIGKGGETIRTINQTSGAHCEIDRHGPQDGPDRTFVIRGTRQQIQHAKELITEKVNTFPPKGVVMFIIHQGGSIIWNGCIVVVRGVQASMERNQGAGLVVHTLGMSGVQADQEILLKWVMQPQLLSGQPTTPNTMHNHKLQVSHTRKLF